MPLTGIMLIFGKPINRIGMEEARLNPEETALLIHIEHRKPVEIADFVAMLNSVGNLYSSYTRNSADSSCCEHPRLYVEKIEKGSIDVYLVGSVVTATFSFMEHSNTILSFSKALKGMLDCYLNGETAKPGYSVAELKELKNIFGVSAHDRYSTTSIGATSLHQQGGTSIYNRCTFNFMESNSAQNQLTQEIGERSKTMQQNELKNQLMTIQQMVGNMGKTKGNKAIIEAVEKRAVCLLFESDELKNRILYMDENPTKKAFYVDVVLMNANGKLAAYKVTALHDIIDLQE